MPPAKKQSQPPPPPRLPPHPLVVGLAARQGSDVVQASTVASRVVGQIAAGARQAGALRLPADARIDAVGVTAGEPALITLAGYLGGCVTGGEPPTQWQLLFLDNKLVTWMIVPYDQILVHSRVTDDTAAFGERDLLWVNAEALVGRGDTTESVQGRFLTGPFTRAGDVAASVTGGTFTAASGLLCEAVTPGCCTRKSY
jgi:hypothetical protein